MVDPKLVAAQTALTRAHNSSRFGSAAARSGSIDDRSAYVQAILSKAQASARSWANWEAIYYLTAPRTDATNAANWLELNAIRQIQKALARDAILSAYGLSDPHRGDRLTFCQLAMWLDDEKTVERLSGREWAIELGYAPSDTDDASEANAARVEHFMRLVVANWKNTKPLDTELSDLRTLLWPTRNHLAHALDASISEPTTIDQIRRFLSLTLELANDAALIWTGMAVGAKKTEEFARKEADRFWIKAFAEPIRLWRVDMQNRKELGVEL